jgi:glutathione S-transferase
MLELSGMEWEDKRLGGADWRGSALKAQSPYGQMPILTLPDGRMLAQCRAITRYVGKMTHVDGKSLYPKDDDLTAFYADELMDGCMDVQKCMAKTFALSGDERKVARASMFKEGGLCFEITAKVEARVKAIGAAHKYACADYLTVGDVMLFTWFNTLRCGFLDDVDNNFLSQYPAIQAKVHAIASHPAVKKYYAGRSGFYECFQECSPP